MLYYILVDTPDNLKMLQRTSENMPDTLNMFHKHIRLLARNTKHVSEVLKEITRGKFFIRSRGQGHRKIIHFLILLFHCCCISVCHFCVHFFLFFLQVLFTSHLKTKHNITICVDYEHVMCTNIAICESSTHHNSLK